VPGPCLGLKRSFDRHPAPHHLFESVVVKGLRLPISGFFSEVWFEVTHTTVTVACPVRWPEVRWVFGKVRVGTQQFDVLDCEGGWVVGVFERVVDWLGAVHAQSTPHAALLLELGGYLAVRPVRSGVACH
jgi:hypothetical protein